VVSPLPPGAGDSEPRAPVREPLHHDEREGHGDGAGAPPPSERGRVVPDHQGVGVFRLAGWGWGATIAIVLFVGVIILVGWLRDDPGRNPAPEGYAPAVCAAATELAAGTAALRVGVETGSPDAAAEVEARVEAAVDALSGLPEWIPGRALDELLGAQIITLTNGAAALTDGDDRATDDLQTASGIGDEMAGHLDGRYGFSC
jgi:hypothetical protein